MFCVLVWLIDCLFASLLICFDRVFVCLVVKQTNDLSILITLVIIRLSICLFVPTKIVESNLFAFAYLLIH